MGRMFYENQGTRTYLVYELEEQEELDSMGIGMLTNNRIPGLAQTIFTQMDRKRYIKYDVTAKLTANDFLAGTVNRKRLLGVLQGMVTAMLSADDYMIDVHSILFDADYIFTDVSSCATEMIVLPIVNTEREVPDAGQFFSKFVNSILIRLDQTENCDYAFKLISYLSVSTAFSLYSFKQLIDELSAATGSTSGSTLGPAAGPKPGSTQGPAAEPTSGPAPRSGIDVHGGSGMRRSDSQDPGRRQEEPHVVPVKPAVNGDGIRSQGGGNIGGPKTGGGNINIPGGKIGMAIPGKTGMDVPVTGSSPVDTGTQPADTGNEISLFYLLQHYNKENAAAYKAQKEAKEAKKQSQQSQTPKKEAKKKGKAKKEKNQDTGYAIPGQAGGQESHNYGQDPGFVSTGGGNGMGNIPVNGGSSVYGTGNAPVDGGNGVYGTGNAPINGGSNVYGTGNAPVDGGNGVYGTGNAPISGGNGGSGSFGGTVLLKPEGGSKPTTVLGKRNQSERPTPHLIRLRTQQKIMITSSPFKIGRDPNYADYCIADNDAVGRSHAVIIMNPSGCFVKDTNSTNHTFVNGQMIQSNQEIPLNDCDRVRFADEEFEFRLRG